MRIFLFGWNHKSEDHIAIASQLQKKSHEIIYWATGSDNMEVDRLKFPSTIFHNIIKASWGIPAHGVEASEFLPLDKDLIEKMCNVESIVLTMMNKRFDWMCTDERKHLYYNLLQYWTGILNKYKPDVIIFINIPHTIYDYIVYELAKRTNIKTVLFDNILISDRCLVLNDFRKGSDLVHKALQKNSRTIFTIQDLSEDLREYYLKQIDEKYDSTPRYIKEDKKENTFGRVIFRKIKIIYGSVRDGSIFAKASNYIFKVFGENVKREYIQIQSTPDFSKKFIYAPLSYQPECTTSPQGDTFVDQILTIEALAASIPSDWVVYVKEHPVQWLSRGLNYYSSRYKGYYRKIAAIKNVYVVPIETDNYELIRASQAVATATGTTGLEAVLRLKPAIIFGYPWYQNCPFLLRASSVESCKQAINKIINGFSINKQEVINFIKAIDDGTIHAYLNVYVEKNSKLSQAENAQNIVKALLKEMEDI